MMWPLPTALNAAHYRFHLVADEPMPLPRHKGAVLRGGFGVTFKRMVCIHRDPIGCTPCKLGNVCPYGYVFETSPPPGSEVLRNLSDVPAPFILRPPLDERTLLQAGDALKFHLVLVGRGIQYLPYFVEVFRKLGENGLGKYRACYTLTRVEAVNPIDGTSQVIFHSGEDFVADTVATITAQRMTSHASQLPKDRVTLRFLTPVRLKFNGLIVNRPDFHVLVRHLLRRLSSLAYFQCGQLWDFDFLGAIAAAQEVNTDWTTMKWIDRTRFSTRQDRQMNLGGIEGDVCYQGDLAQFHALLVAGAILNVGKATAFGNGWYQLQP